MESATIYCSHCGAGNRANATYCFSCGQAIHVGTPAIAGTGRIPPQQMLKERYKIVLLVGKGGMGAVYKAEDTQFGSRLVAVKEMSQSKLSLEEASEAADQFKQEAHLLANLKHPNLPSIYDYFGENGRWYLVMDFIEGTTLDARLATVADHILPVDESIEIGIQLAKVLGYLHTRAVPIIFRDLKPLNIMVTPEDNIYLIDFGIARLFKTGKDKDTIAYVSPGYAAPEQFGSTQTSPQSDIYSLGATLHRLLSGNEPRSNMPLFTFKPLASYNPNIPTALSDLVAKMVSIDPAERPTSMIVIRQELERIHMQVKQTASQLSSTQYATPTPPVSVPSYTTAPQPPPTQKQEQVSSIPAEQTQEQVYFTPAKQAQEQVYSPPASQTPAKPALPKGRLWKTLLTGVVTGVLTYVLLSLIGFFTVVTICLALGLLSIIAGVLVGFVVIRRGTGFDSALRRTGFFVGCVAGLAWDIVLAISYPVALTSAVTLFYFPLFIIVAAICGLVGAWLATINHPFFKKP